MATNSREKLQELYDKLPEICTGYLFATGTEKATSTRLAYARELYRFFFYLIETDERFFDIPLKDIGIKQIKEITSQDISIYLTLNKDKGLKERTLARMRSSLSDFFEYLTNNRLIEYNPVKAAVKVKIHQSDQVKHLNMQEQIQLLNNVDSGDGLTLGQLKRHERYRVRDYSIILMFLDTGLRISELQQIDIKDVDLDDNSVFVIRKGGNGQTIYFSDETKEAIKDLILEKETKAAALPPDEPLFTTTKGNRLTTRAIEKIVAKYTDTVAPGRDISPHKLRSSFAMEFYRSEKDILRLQKKLGHKNIQTTNIYAKATSEDMKESRSVLGDLRDRYRDQK